MSTSQPQGTAALGRAIVLTSLFLQVGVGSAGTAEGTHSAQPARVVPLRETGRTSSPTGHGHQIAQSVVDPWATTVIEVDSWAPRPTTELEKLVGELRSWRALPADWDGEGAAQPSISSLKEAEAFARLLRSSAAIPEAMLNANGHAGLLWKNSNLYADLEFLGDGRLAYYVERNGGKHKGVDRFSSEQVPAVLKLLLSTQSSASMAA